MISVLPVNQSGSFQSSKMTQNKVCRQSNPLRANVLYKPVFKGSILNSLSKELQNVGEVIPSKLYRSAAPSPDKVQILKKLGITTIFDLRNNYKVSPHYLKALEEAGIKRISIDMDKITGLKKAISEVKDLAKKENECGLIQCEKGDDATGVFAYLIDRMVNRKTDKQASKVANKHGCRADFMEIARIAFGFLKKHNKKTIDKEKNMYMLI